MMNLTTVVTANLTILNSTGRIVLESSVPLNVVAAWTAENGFSQMVTDVEATLSLANLDNLDTAVLTLKSDDGEELGEQVMGTMLFTRNQMNGFSHKIIGANLDEDADDTGVTAHEFEMRFIRVLPDGNTLRREFYDNPVMLSLADGYAAAMAYGKEQVNKRMARARHAVNIEFELSYMNELVGSGTASGVLNETEFDETAIAASVATDLEFTTMRHRKDVMSIMAGMSVREFVRDGLTGEAMNPSTLRSFTQEGVYAKVKTLVVMDVNEYDKGKLTGTKRKMISRVMHEPAHGLLDYADEFISVFINSSLMQSLQEPENYEALLEWVKERMATTSHPHFIVGRKKRLIFGRKPFGETGITRDFQRVNVNRAEHLGQLVTARGIRATGSIPTPELVDMKVPDGVYMALTLKLGMMLGLTEGVWQVRGVAPYVKGTIVVSRFISKPFLNVDAIKVKPDGEWPTMIFGDNIIAIRNSDEAYDMRFSHQLGYLFVDNFLEAKGKIKPWGKLPKLMAAAAEGALGRRRVESTLPTEYSRLQSYGLPYDYYRQPDTLEEVLVRAFRPQFAKLTMFVALPIERLDPKYFDKVGMYMPAAGDEGEEGRYWVRIPALAVGGAVQDLYTLDANGEPILVDKASPMLNVTVAAIHEPTVIGKDDEGEDILQFPDDVELGGAGRSRIIWSMMAAMGADSDGDMTGRTFKAIDPFLESAGLKATWDVPLFKTKLAYRGIDGWDEHMRGKLWAVSTPKLANVGMGDVMTQRCTDIIMEGHMNSNVWAFQRRAGAQKTQSGVSASKYDTIMTEKALLTDIQVNNLMRDKQVGDGFNSKGLLFQPTIDLVRGHLKALFPEAAQYRQVTCTHKARKWEGGMSGFLDRLANFDEQMGDFWVTHVKESFKHELLRMVTIGLTGEERAAAVKKFSHNFRAGIARNMVRGYVAAFIQQHPDKHNIWAWLLDPEFIRPQSNDRRPDGLALSAPNIDMDNSGQILEVMGMPFNLEKLNERAAILKAKEEERKEKQRNK